MASSSDRRASRGVLGLNKSGRNAEPGELRKKKSNQIKWKNQINKNGGERSNKKWNKWKCKEMDALMEKKSKEWIVQHNGRYIGGLGGKRKNKNTHKLVKSTKETHEKKTLKKQIKKKKNGTQVKTNGLITLSVLTELS